ncbi:MAG: porin family protein [Candidatus Adiutrix intracellularis]|jgi:opacity protein-like surface antigen|nr:porin family protein [Candidatus Adiutrix intracellularis]
MKRNLEKLNLMLILTALTVVASVTPLAAQDLSSFYVTPKVLYSYQSGNVNGPAVGGEYSKSVFGLGLSVGTDFSYSTSLPIRLEVEYLYHGKNKFDNVNNNVIQSFDISSHSFLANAFFDIDIDTAFTPYVGGGLGLAYVNTDSVTNFLGNFPPIISLKHSGWNFAWNVGGGVAWSLSESMTLDLGYRYVDLGRSDTGFQYLPNVGSSVDLTAHELSLGLRFSGF